MDYYYEEQPDSSQFGIELNLVQNKKPLKKSTIKLHRNLDFQEFKQAIFKALQINKTNQFRIFKQNGVEIFEDDIKYIKEQETLYVSTGEEFNQESVLSEFETLNVLGEGGFGQVVLAQNKVSGEQVAIKYVNKDVAVGNINDIQMIFGEANALKNLQHKNIVKMHNCYIFQDMRAVFIMEYLKGGDLSQYLKNDPNKFLDEKKSQFIFRQIVDAIYYCHQRKIIHRDLKLENIMIDSLDEDFIIKVCDFGISGIFCKINTNQTISGSPKYISPEVLIEKCPAKPSMDIWSMGVILYQMLHGYCPFEGETCYDTFELIKKGQFEFKQQVLDVTSKCCIQFIQSMLQLDPQNRITTVEISNHPWITKEIDDILLDEKKQQQELNNKLQKEKERIEKEKNDNKKLQIKPDKLKIEQKTYLNFYKK